MNLSRNNNALDIQDVTKSFDGACVLDSLSFGVPMHRVVALLGQSGCGKTTLLNIISGISAPDHGHILLQGKDITSTPGYVSYMQQDDLLLPWKRLIDNIALPLVIKGETTVEARAIVKPYLPLFGLDNHTFAYPWELSGGMRQRAALLRTYICSKECIILDEPFGALDVITRSAMQEWLLSVVDELKPSVLFVTHDVQEALLLADTIVIMAGHPAHITDTIHSPVPREERKALLHSATFSDIRQRIWDAL